MYRQNTPYLQFDVLIFERGRLNLNVLMLSLDVVWLVQ